MYWWIPLAISAASALMKQQQESNSGAVAQMSAPQLLQRTNMGQQQLPITQLSSNNNAQGDVRITALKNMLDQ